MTFKHVHSHSIDFGWGSSALKRTNSGAHFAG